MLHCAPTQLRLGSRRSRSFPLLTALVALVITSTLLRRQTNISLNNVAVREAPRPPHPTQAAFGEPLEFYGAARHLSDHRRTLEVPRSSGQGHTESATTARGRRTGHDPAVVTGLPSAQATDHHTWKVTGQNPAKIADDDQAQVESDDRSGAKSPNQTEVPGEAFLRWDRTIPAATEEQLRPLTSDWLWRRYLEQRKRRETLVTACRKHNVTLGGDAQGLAGKGRSAGRDLVEVIKASHMSVVPQLKTLVCLVNKVASTSLLGTLLKLAGHGVPVYSHNLSSPHAHARALRPERAGELEVARREYVKVLFVRHPLDRLISAYEDKVKRAEHKSLLALREAIFSAHERFMILDKAVDLYSKNQEKKVELSKAYYSELAAYKKDVQKRNNVPTFQEFLDFVLNGELTGDSFDSHWTPYWRQCAPCHMNYDVIGKLETGADDFKYVWNLLGIYRTVGIPWLHQRPLHASLEERLAAYLGPLRADTVRRLRALFRPDFDMFGYDWRRTLDVSGHCRPGEPCDLE